MDNAAGCVTEWPPHVWRRFKTLANASAFAVGGDPLDIVTATPTTLAVLQSVIEQDDSLQCKNDTALTCSRLLAEQSGAIADAIRTVDLLDEEFNDSDAYGAQLGPLQARLAQAIEQFLLNASCDDDIRRAFGVGSCHCAASEHQ